MEKILDILLENGCEIDKDYYLQEVKNYRSKEEVKRKIEDYIDTFIKTNTCEIKDVSVALVLEEDTYFYGNHKTTLYDLASITKLFTLKAIYELEKENKIEFTNPIHTYLMEFEGLGNYTIWDAIKMTGRIETDGKLSDTKDYATFTKVLETVQLKESKNKANYTDIEFIILGKVIEKVTGKNLKDYFKENIFFKQDMKNTCFMPSHDFILKGNGNTLYLPHDFKTRVAHGVTGAAGLFSNVEDLSLFARRLWEGKVFDKDFIQEIYDYTFVDTSNRNRSLAGLYKKTKEYRSYIPREFSDFSLGHQGFTGSVFVVDLKLHMAQILLFDAIPNESKNKNPDFISNFYEFRDKITKYLILFYLLSAKDSC
jgi:CubicO group peptidase (beta-lactamase class C family)